jgi:hypothetical protein
VSPLPSGYAIEEWHARVQDLMALGIFAVALCGGLLVLMLGWIAVQGMRR